jgi:putative hydrolase of the HAD superfamily
MPVRAVIFDFYGTLAESAGAGLAWADLFSEIGHTLSQDAIDRLWNQGNDGVEHVEHSQSRDHYVAWQQARLRQIIAESGVPEGDDDLLFARMTELLGTQDLKAYPESREILDELRDRGLTLAICSNWNWDLLEAIDNAGLTGTVDIVESSAWVGARKPHPRIYAWMLERLAIAPADALFVGDTWTCDVEGPRQAGMRPVYLRRPHFGPDRTEPEDPDDTGVTRAADLTALRVLLPPRDRA